MGDLGRKIKDGLLVSALIAGAGFIAIRKGNESVKIDLAISDNLARSNAVILASSAYQDSLLTCFRSMGHVNDSILSISNLRTRRLANLAYGILSHDPDSSAHAIKMYDSLQKEPDFADQYIDSIGLEERQRMCAAEIDRFKKILKGLDERRELLDREFDSLSAEYNGASSEKSK